MLPALLRVWGDPCTQGGEVYRKDRGMVNATRVGPIDRYDAIRHSVLLDGVASSLGSPIEARSPKLWVSLCDHVSKSARTFLCGRNICIGSLACLLK